jgi:isopenicillin N synthase-like dioxygenase
LHLTDQVSISQSVMGERRIPKISMHNPTQRRDEIARQIIDAAENSGFFILENQESPSIKDIEEMFALSLVPPFLPA